MRTLVSFLFLQLFISTVISHAEPITLAADEWCPYNCDPSSAEPGYMIEIVKEVFKGKGHEIQYSIMPWARAIEESRAGRQTGIIGAFKSDAPDFIFPDRDFGDSGSIFYVKKGSTWNYSDIASLEKVSIAVIQDYSYNDDVDPYIAKHKDDSGRVQIGTGDNALEKNVNKLLSGRVSAVLEDSHVMDHFLKKSALVNQVSRAGGINPEKVYIAFSPVNSRSKEYAHMLSEGINALEKSGKLKEILAKYGL